MKGKIITILVGLLVISVIIAGNSIAGGDNGFSTNPVTSGDGESDGSEYHYDGSYLEWPNQGIGPAPSSGDGESDGPGW